MKKILTIIASVIVILLITLIIAIENGSVSLTPNPSGVSGYQSYTREVDE